MNKATDTDRGSRLRLRRPELNRLLDQVLEHLVPIDQPLVLVSQIQRSGGTLLSQLLDGHPELHVHPAELHIGHPKKDVWPELRLEAPPREQFETLVERSHQRLFEEGYRKRMREHQQYDAEFFPFMQPPSLLASLFRCLVPRSPENQREVIDAYFTAYFNAWLDNRHLRDGPKRWIAAFTPGLAVGSSRARLAADYPDGRVIALVRDPRAWYASARAHHPRYADCEHSVGLWAEAARDLVDAARERPESMLVLRFDDLVTETAATMELLADWLAIDFDESLLAPTFNDLPIRANSSFMVAESGILRDVLDRGGLLSPTETETVDRIAGAAYEEALGLAQRSK